jgi:hypothetical protein
MSEVKQCDNCMAVYGVYPTRLKLTQGLEPFEISVVLTTDPRRNRSLDLCPHCIRVAVEAWCQQLPEEDVIQTVEQEGKYNV